MFELRLTEHVTDSRGQAAAIGDEDLEWRAIRYDFVLVQTDAGMQVGLIEVRQAGLTPEGFFSSLAPLAYSGAIE